MSAARHLPARCRRPELTAGLAFANLPTPVRRLDRFGAAIGAEAWIKDDGRSAPGYGGNKPRKLEFLLADARRQGAARVVTAGALGSNHCMATAIHGREAGFRVSLLLGPQPVDDGTRRQILDFQAHGAELLWFDRYELLDAQLQMVAAEIERREGAAPYWIPMGGSSPLGALGFVEAGLELAAQVRAGELPCPERIFVAAGTCGTLAGLAVGLALSRLPTRLVGVRVTPTTVGNRELARDLIHRIGDLLARAGCEGLAAGSGADAFEMLDEYFGAGYAVPSEEGRRAVALLRETEGIALEQTYTGKTLAALVDAARGAKGPLLFWNTRNAVDYHTPVAGRCAPADLPSDFRQFFPAGADGTGAQLA